MKLKVAIVVHGRFHAFDLARALAVRGHEVTLFTIYPPWMTQSLRTVGVRVHGLWLYGIAQKLLGPVPGLARAFEPALHRFFGRWAAARVGRERWDLVHCWSSVSEELLRARQDRGTLVLLVRGSAHIRAQATILENEERRAGVPLGKPSPWILRREEREYRLAKHIRVLSEFTRRSFVEQGVENSKLRLIPSGMPVEAFRPSRGAVEDRVRRILSGEALCVLYVGALSFRKGLYDIAEAVQRLPVSRFHFRLVGPVLPEARETAERLRGRGEVISRQAEKNLPDLYAQADMFLFPTLEDGYAQTLAQAYAAGLPIVTTDQCAGPDFLTPKDGWVIPAGSPEALIFRLSWAEGHREELASIAGSGGNRRLRTWAEVVLDLERFVREQGGA